MISGIRSGVPYPAILATLACLPLGLVTALAQTPPRPPGEVPYLNFPPVAVPGALQPAPTLNVPPELKPSTNPVPIPATTPRGLEIIKQRDQELATIRADQRRALENETKLKREIE